MTDWAFRGVDLETFKGFDQPTRALILRLLDKPTDGDWDALKDHPNAAILASWLGELPAYRGGYEDDE
jgi:hypothetical protein